MLKRFPGFHRFAALLLCSLLLQATSAQTVDIGGTVGGRDASVLSTAPAPAGQGGTAPNLVPASGARMGGGIAGQAGLPGNATSSREQAAAARAASAAQEQEVAAGRTAFANAPLGETEYQKFIRETTGQKLPLFGYELFAAGRFPSLKNVPVPVDYVVGPGDELRLKLWGAVDVDLSLTVDRNGQITIPKVGTVNVAGLKASQLEPMLKAQVGRVFTNFNLSATLGQLRSMQIYVVGQARQPGAYTVSSISSLISALFESGGPAATGSMRNIELKRGGQLVTTIDLYKFIIQGDTTADAQLLPGDVIVIPPAGPRVTLLGLLDRPAIYELASTEEPLSQVLGYAGGVPAVTTLNKVLVEHINREQVKAPRSVESRALDAAGLASTVRDGDMVTLFKISPQFANAVTLRGNVAAPLRYAYREGLRVADLIPEREALIQADYYTRKNAMVQFETGAVVKEGRVAMEVKNLLEEINWDYAVIERLDAKEVRTQLIPFNLGKAVLEHDPANNLELRPGDVVTIFGVDDLPVPIEKRTQFVRIAGEVKVPGIYQIQPGETLPNVIQRAGGLTSNAYPYGMVFTRESTRIQQQANLDRAIRRMEADVVSSSARTAQNLQDTDKAFAEAQRETQRETLTRLRGLKASGRIALELDPVNPELPALALEDGDDITVPNRPSFVGVFGAVMAETSFLYRTGATVQDYIDRAGLTAEAEEDATLLIRADGSVESNPAIRSWFANNSFMDRTLQPGDSIFVPERLDRRTSYTRFIQGAKDWTAIMFQFGLGAAAIKTLR